MTRWFRWFRQPGTFVLTVLLSLTALVLALVRRTPQQVLCCAGMLASTMGDLINTNWRGMGSRLPFPALYGGAACFAVAHSFYTAAFAAVLRSGGLPLVNTGFLLAAVCVLAAGALVSVLCFCQKNVNRLTYAVCLVYLCFVGSTLAAAFACGAADGGLHLLAAVGALSFFVSDLLIGLNVLCGVQNDFVLKGVWWFYPIGQLLLIVFV